MVLLYVFPGAQPHVPPFVDGHGSKLFDRLIVAIAPNLDKGEALFSMEERKAMLGKILAKALAGIQFSEHLEGDGAAIFAHACKLGCEGIVSKRADAAYRSGPSKVWLKIKNPAAPGVLRFQDRT